MTNKADTVVEEKTNQKTEVPKEVRCSRFGCINCLWNSCECKSGSKYSSKIVDGKLGCKSYTYFD